MSQYSRRTLVRGAAWSIPVIAVAAQAPAFAASHDAPVVSSVLPICRSTGQGSNCHTYRLRINFAVSNSYSWSIGLLAADIIANGSASGGIVLPAFPVVIDATNSSIELTFCSSSSPSTLDLQFTYSATRTDGAAPPATTLTYPSPGNFASFSGIDNKCP